MVLHIQSANFLYYCLRSVALGIIPVEPYCTQRFVDQYFFDIEYIAQIRRFKTLFLFYLQKR